MILRIDSSPGLLWQMILNIRVFSILMWGKITWSSPLQTYINIRLYHGAISLNFLLFMHVWQMCKVSSLLRPLVGLGSVSFCHKPISKFLVVYVFSQCRHFFNGNSTVLSKKNLLNEKTLRKVLKAKKPLGLYFPSSIISRHCNGIESFISEMFWEIYHPCRKEATGCINTASTRMKLKLHFVVGSYVLTLSSHLSVCFLKNTSSRVILQQNRLFICKPVSCLLIVNGSRKYVK